jgi:glycerate 2-kinase
MRVLLAPDKFKGSLSAREVTEHLEAGIRAVAPDVELVRVPVADGGDGTVDAAVDAGYRRVPVRVAGPTGQPVDTAYAERDGIAVVELADACGLARLPDGALAPLTASSQGFGEVVRAALDAGVHRVVLAVGGSASTDGGAGMLAALGARFLDEAGRDLPPGGAVLARLDRVDPSGLHPRLADVEVLLASDVDNPLLGERGAATVYGPQKGATPADVAVLEDALSRLSTALDRATGRRGLASTPGAGAAGGVGFGAIAALGAEPRPGIELLLELIGFHDHLPDARLVVTGEGSLDEQTLHGKAPAGVASAARAAGVPVVAVAGRSLLSAQQLAAVGVRKVYALSDLQPDLTRSIAEAGPLLERVGAQLARDWLAEGNRGVPSRVAEVRRR